MRFRLVVDGESHEVDVDGVPPALTVQVDGASYHAKALSEGPEFEVRIGSRRHRVRIRGRQVVVDGLTHEVAADVLDASDRMASGGESARSGTVLEIRPPMPGRVVKLAVGAGDRVKRGQTLAVLEAMKMQNEISAPADGVVRSVGVREGESILGDRIIAVLESR